MMEFINFIPDCPNDSRIKLYKEIEKMEYRLEEIKKMDLKKLNEEVTFYFETKQSKLNKIEL